MVRQGIEAANMDLKKENDERLMHEVMQIYNIPLRVLPRNYSGSTPGIV